MEANELRLNNWVNHCNKEVQITIHDLFDIVVFEDDVFTPIPLTEEILLKFGFEKTDDYGDIIYYEPKDRGNRNYYICFDHEDISFGLNVFGNCTNLLHDDSNLQFLHQLQNLYFALTGEELILKN